MMYKCLITLILLLGVGLFFLTGHQAQAQDPQPSLSSSDESFPPKGMVPADLTPADVIPANKIIDIATSDQDETNPAVALCASNQYLTVYEQDGKIYGQRLTADGELLGGDFVIFENNGLASNELDVACDWGRDRFIVVWTHYFPDDNPTYYHTLGQGVYGKHQTSGSQLQGSSIGLDVGADHSEYNPAIACNSDDHTCLVVYKVWSFENKNYFIAARRVNVGVDDNSALGPAFVINEGSPISVPEIDPDVAWGGANNNYLVVWSALYYASSPDNNHYRVVFRHIHDTQQTGDQWQDSPTWLIDPGLRDNNQTAPAVAYNRNTGQYLVSFQFDFSGDDKDYDIYARRVEGVGSSTIGEIFSVAATSSNETNPAVAFSNGPENLPGSGANQFLVSYRFYDLLASNRIYVEGIKGVYNPDGSQQDGLAQVIATSGVTSSSLLWPDVTGSVNNGRYLTVWQYLSGGSSPDSNILGRLIAPYGLYLPLILHD